MLIVLARGQKQEPHRCTTSRSFCVPAPMSRVFSSKMDICTGSAFRSWVLRKLSMKLDVAATTNSHDTCLNISESSRTSRFPLVVEASPPPVVVRFEPMGWLLVAGLYRASCPRSTTSTAGMSYREGRFARHVRVVRLRGQGTEPSCSRQGSVVRDEDRLGLHGAAIAWLRTGACTLRIHCPGSTLALLSHATANLQSRVHSKHSPTFLYPIAPRIL